MVPRVYIDFQIGLRGNRSPSAFPNNLPKTGLLIIQRALGFRACDKRQEKKTDGAKRGSCEKGR